MKLPNFLTNLNEYHIDLGLESMKDLLARIGNPERKIENIIHIAGTNGKGSIAAFLRGMLEKSGFSVNLYTSPHLVEFNERIYLKGLLISDEAIQKFTKICEMAMAITPEIKPTFFEVTTAISMLAFAKDPADFNIFEVGLGGRLDATNVFDAAKISIITEIDFDHTELLGESLSEIAREKAGIITRVSRLFVGDQKDEAYRSIKEIADNLGIEAEFYQDFFEKISVPEKLGLAGEFQKKNFILAAKVFQEISKLPVPADFKVTWRARLEKLSSSFYDLDQDKWQIWLDGGHNLHAALALQKWIIANEINQIVIGMVRRKDLLSFAKELAKTGANLFFTEIISNAESFKVSDLENDVELDKIFKGKFSSYSLALSHIKSDFNSGKILICGSLFLAGEVLSFDGKRN